MKFTSYLLHANHTLGLKPDRCETRHWCVADTWHSLECRASVYVSIGTYFDIISPELCVLIKFRAEELKQVVSWAERANSKYAEVKSDSHPVSRDVATQEPTLTFTTAGQGLDTLARRMSLGTQTRSISHPQPLFTTLESVSSRFGYNVGRSSSQRCYTRSRYKSVQEGWANQGASDGQAVVPSTSKPSYERSAACISTFELGLLHASLSSQQACR